MSLQGLPDFHNPIRFDEGLMYYPYEGAGGYLVAAMGVEVAEKRDGKPDFHLSIVRGPNPALPPLPHGVVDLRLCAQYAEKAAFSWLRRQCAGATVVPCAFAGGWFRLQPVHALEGEIPADLVRA